MVKYLPSTQEMWVRFLGGEDPLEKEMTAPLQYSCLGNPTGEPGGLQSMRSQKSRTQLCHYTTTRNISKGPLWMSSG